MCLTTSVIEYRLLNGMERGVLTSKHDLVDWSDKEKALPIKSIFKIPAYNSAIQSADINFHKTCFIHCLSHTLLSYWT